MAEIDIVDSTSQAIEIVEAVDETIVFPAAATTSVSLDTGATVEADLVEEVAQDVELARTGAKGEPGEPGTDGVDGQDGAPGTPGVGLPVGGNVGQLPFKQSGTDYDVEWEDLITCKQSDLYGYQATSEDATYEYIFKEDKDGNWLIVRLHKTTDVATYSRGTGGYASIYVDADSAPSGSHTWASYGATF